MAPSYRYSLAGTRADSEPDGLVCGVCRSSGAPALFVLRHQSGKELTPTHRFCLPCIGRACENVTGWRIMAAWSQWLASSRQSWNLKADAWTANGEDFGK